MLKSKLFKKEVISAKKSKQNDSLIVSIQLFILEGVIHFEDT